MDTKFAIMLLMLGIIAFLCWLIRFLIKDFKLQFTDITAMKSFDAKDGVAYFEEQLKKIGFTEFKDGCFAYGERFKVAFSVGDCNESVLPMQVIFEEKPGLPRKYFEYMEMFSVSQIRRAYTKLTGEPL